MRNIKNYAIQGAEKIRKNQRYDILASELDEVAHIFIDSSNSEGLMDALITAYRAGVESGYRMRGTVK